MENENSIQEILKEILQKNINLLSSRTELEEQLEARISGRMRRDFNTIRLAMQANIGGILLTGVNASSWTEKERVIDQVREVLTKNALQPQRIDFVLDTFKYALNWPRQEENLNTSLSEADGENCPGAEAAPAEAPAEPLDQLGPETQLAPEFQRLAVNAEAVWQTAPPKEPAAPAGTTSGGSVRDSDWKCVCGKLNRGNFCTRCGHPRIVNQVRQFWTCRCGKLNDGDFCTQCGLKKPVQQPPGSWVCPVCYKVNTGPGRYCTKCGTKRN